MTDMNKEASQLDRLFAEARSDMAPLPDGLSGRILADAAQVQAGFHDAAVVHVAPIGFWRQLVATLGGWPVMGGLATACAAGIWIGLAPPSFLPDPAQLLVGAQSTIDLIEPYDLVMALSEEQ